MFACSDNRYGFATEEDRDAFIKWLSNHPLVSGLNVGELADVNYGIE